MARVHRDGLTPRQLAIELEFNASWERALDVLLVRYKTWANVAARLHVHKDTLRRWRVERAAAQRARLADRPDGTVVALDAHERHPAPIERVS